MKYLAMVLLFVALVSLTMAKPTTEIESFESSSSQEKTQSASSGIARDKRGLLFGAAYTAPLAYTAPVAYTSSAAYTYSPYSAYSAYSPSYPYYAAAAAAPYYLA